MKILFRVEAGGKTGLGHYFRSVYLAEKLRSRGHNITISHTPSPFWNQINLDFENISLGNQCESQTLEILKTDKYDVFFVDSILDFSDEFYEQLEKEVLIIFYQNISNTRHLCHVYIDPALHRDEQFYSNFLPRTSIYKGLAYSILNPKINSIRPKSELPPEVKKIAVSSGGSDPKNVLMIFHKLIHHRRFFPIEFTYYFGEDFMHKSTIPNGLESNVSFKLFNHNSIANSDLLICTFGVTTYEFMALGIPIISVGHQSENAKASKYLSQTGGIIDLGMIDNVNPVELNQQIEKLINDRDLRDFLSLTGRKQIDKNGAARIIDIIEKHGKERELRHVE